MVVDRILCLKINKLISFQWEIYVVFKEILKRACDMKYLNMIFCCGTGILNYKILLGKRLKMLEALF